MFNHTSLVFPIEYTAFVNIAHTQFRYNRWGDLGAKPPSSPNLKHYLQTFSSDLDSRALLIFDWGIWRQNLNNLKGTLIGLLISSWLTESRAVEMVHIEGSCYAEHRLGSVQQVIVVSRNPPGRRFSTIDIEATIIIIIILATAFWQLLQRRCLYYSFGEGGGGGPLEFYC